MLVLSYLLSVSGHLTRLQSGEMLDSFRREEESLFFLGLRGVGPGRPEVCSQTLPTDWIKD